MTVATYPTQSVRLPDNPIVTRTGLGGYRYLAYAFTLVRLPLACLFVITFSTNRAIAMSLGVAAVASDFLDGICEGKCNRDLPLRNAYDGCVDRIATYTIMTFAIFEYAPHLIGIMAVLVARDVATGVVNATYFRKGLVIKTPRIHGIGSASHVAFCITVLFFGPTPISLAAGMADIAVSTLLGIHIVRMFRAFRASVDGHASIDRPSSALKVTRI